VADRKLILVPELEVTIQNKTSADWLVMMGNETPLTVRKGDSLILSGYKEKTTIQIRDL
jgi:hypothetical protein